MLASFSVMVVADSKNTIKPILIKAPGAFSLNSPEPDKKIVNLQLMLEDCFISSNQFVNKEINYHRVLENINQIILNSNEIPVISCKEIIAAYKKN